MALQSDGLPSQIGLDEAKNWYSKNRPLYEGLAEVIRQMLENIIKERRIDFLSVTGRAKTLTSFLDKIEKKKYGEPSKQCQDLAGIRVVTYTESDARAVGELILSALHVHPDDSPDKSIELGVNRMGYRSLHFVCDIGVERAALPELSRYAGLVFEVQVRTALQHAWAEIEHDRNYKFSGRLRADLQRRLYVAAGTLELVDREFDALGRELDHYTEEVSKAAAMGEFEIELNTTSLQGYLESSAFLNKGFKFEAARGGLEKVTEELLLFNIDKLSGVEALLTPDFMQAYRQCAPSGNTDVGILRAAMMYQDLAKYFDRSWRNNWNGVVRSVFEILAAKYGRSAIINIFAPLEVYVEEEEVQQ